MLNKIASKFTNRLLSQNIIEREYFDIYVYGFELLISFFLSTSTIVLIGIILGCIEQTIVFLAVFILLRSFSGGYHATTYSMCAIVTLFTYGLVIFLSSYVYINHLGYMLLGITGFLLLALFAPVEHPNKVTTRKQKLYHKLISLILFIAFLSVGIRMSTIKPILGNVVFYSLSADLLLLFVKNKRRKEKRNEIC